ncbi:hypothetical protein NXZ75_22260 [Lysinibacillus sphaericus]|uniref:hypothetical protein n=1 Tax=Lysinibacillus sphaericus TaxID=1421 RepID=UPI002163BF5D|nr:hypothetical protein [Lysinibacillus sphaericus]MCS1384880.1 hypothetical protein [Lysinibacillus sphaericus]
MLQIITDKFFSSEHIHNTERKVIVYSNMDINGIVATKIGTLEPIDKFSTTPTYLFTYNNRMENNGPGPVAIGDAQIIDDFLAMCSFWFQGIFSTDKNLIKYLTRDKKENSINEQHLPKDIIPLIFTKRRIFNKLKNEQFSDFFNAVINLKRSTYKQIIKTIRQYRDALLTINSNLELSYTMFVASVESLSGQFSDYTSNWNDVDKVLKESLDEILATLEPEIANDIKNRIIENSHLKIARRYTEFSISNISDSFFLEDARGIKYPCRKSQISSAIKNSYQIRSKYVHSLKELPNIFSLSGDLEVFKEGKDLYFTLAGLSRFIREVIISFIYKQEPVISEKIDYSGEIPNTISLPMSPSLWINNAQNYNVKNSKEYFNALLVELVPSLTLGKPLIDLTEVCDAIIKLIKGVSKEQKVPMSAFYIIYNMFLKEEYRHSNSENFLEEYTETTDILATENIILHLLFNFDFPWNTTDIYDSYKRYDEKRFQKNQIVLPQIIETCLLIELANCYLNEGNEIMYKEIILKAVYEHPGNKQLIMHYRNIESNIKQKLMIDWKNDILFTNSPS